MSGAVAARLPGNRLHLQHGPIDLIIGAYGARETAFEIATARFATILDDLVSELAILRQNVSRNAPRGETAQRMHRVCLPFLETDLTLMASVAGAVADTVLDAMVQNADLQRAYVNNGGDIALHLSRGQNFTVAISAHDGRTLGEARIADSSLVRGIATSGRHGRSHSLGIADSVTVLARSATEADVAATLIANAVDLPGHPGITRVPACEIDDMTDLGAKPIVRDCIGLSAADAATALATGLARAQDYQKRGLIQSAHLHLAGQTRTLDPSHALKEAAYA